MLVCKKEQPAGRMRHNFPFGEVRTRSRKRRQSAGRASCMVHAPGDASPAADGRLDRKNNGRGDRKSTRLNSSHQIISYAVFCLKKKNSTHALVDLDRKSTRLNSSHQIISYAVFCLRKKNDGD